MTTLNIPPFSRWCRQAAEPVWHACREHPFVRALAKGTLDEKRFRVYTMQDARYLGAFADACSLVSTRFPLPQDKLWCIEGARLALLFEGALHAGYGARLGFTADDIATLELSMNNRAYQDHLVSTALRGTLVEAVAAIAPCMWLYTEIGQRFATQLGDIPDSHPYAAWLQMYSNPQYDAYLEGMFTRLEQTAEAHDERARARARDAFVASAQYELLFWQYAWEPEPSGGKA